MTRNFAKSEIRAHKSKPKRLKTFISMKIGLTGGIGCGKSTALKLFQQQNFMAISADELSHKVLNSTLGTNFVAQNFPSACSEEGLIDRKKLAEIIFSDDSAKSSLEQFIHPQIEKLWREQIGSEQKNCVVEIPLLFEKGYEKEFDQTICIACSLETQLSRLEKRGLPKELALPRINAQLPIEEKIRRADICLYNEGNPDFLNTQIELVMESLGKKSF